MRIFDKLGRFHRVSGTMLLVLGLLLVGPACKKGQDTEGIINPPVAEKIPQELAIHGHTRIDEYYWLKERENPEVIEYLKAENAYLEAVMKPTEALQEKLYNEIVGRIKQTDLSVPYRKNGYYYYTRFVEGGEYPIYCRKKSSLDAEEEILLDVNKMAEGYAYFHVAGHAVSPDNDLIAYGVDTISRRKYTLHFKNLTTGEVYPDEIPNTGGRAAWASDNRTIFYALKDEETLRPFQVMRHTLGSDTAEDKEVFKEADETFNTAVYRSKSDDYMFITSDSTLSTEYRYLDASKPEGQFQIFHPRERGLEYSIDHFGDKFFIRTNLEAKNFRLMSTSVDKTTKENWVEIIPHREDVLLQQFELFTDFLAVSERRSGLTRIRIVRWDDDSEHYVDFGEETYSAYITTNPEFDTPLLRYAYTSLTTPDSTFDYNMETRAKTLLKQEEVLGGFDPGHYHAERLYATARDGVRVPISLVYRMGLEKNGDNPFLLYGYGSYGSSANPSFRSDRLSLLDRGFVFAIAHIRGGQEMGRQWYEDGKLFKKKNTFTDFIDCAEYLIDQKYTNREKLFAMGGSAGGLLIGAVVNLRPDLFEGLVAAVPWVDVVTTMLDSSIPLTTSEYDEWGNPNYKEYYDYMLSYSPYDNVEAKDYPAMLVTTGLHDSQVQYWEPAKWVARLRALKTDANRLLLLTNMGAGHGGVSGRFRRYKETALEYAFFLNLLGIKE